MLVSCLHDPFSLDQPNSRTFSCVYIACSTYPSVSLRHPIGRWTSRPDDDTVVDIEILPRNVKLVGSWVYSYIHVYRALFSDCVCMRCTWLLFTSVLK